MSQGKLEELTQIVGQIKKAYTSFLEYAEQQRKDLVNSDLDGLNQTNRAIDRSLQEAQELEQERLLLMGHLEMTASKKFSKAQEVEDHFRTAASKAFLQAVQSLKEILLKVAKSHEINQRLIRSSREFVRSNMAILTGYAGGKGK